MTQRDPLSGDRPIYLDYHATTPCDPQVAKVVSRCSQRTYGNPSSPHRIGASAQEALEEARRAVADQLGALPGEIIFTSGATESNNISIKGLALGVRQNGGERDTLLTTSVEHKSVIKPATRLTDHDFRHRVIPVGSDGRVDPEVVSDLVDKKTLLVSVQKANNEIGTIHPIKDIASVAHEYGAYFHTDATQALGRLEVDLEEWGVDLASFSAHKAYGPKGIGALYVRGGPNKCPITSLVEGGGQENGLRSGTTNVPGAVGFGEACKIIDEKLASERENMRRLRDRIEREILAEIEDAEVIGSQNHRLVSTTNIRFKGVEAEAILARVPEIAVSTGSACEAGAPEPSHVLQAVGLDRSAAYECVRVAVGRFTTDQEVDDAASLLCEAVRRIKQVKSKAI